MKKLLIGLLALGSLSVFADCNIEFITLHKNVNTQQSPQQQLQRKSLAKDQEEQSLFYSKSASLSGCVSEYKKISAHASKYANSGCNIEKVEMRYDYNGTVLYSKKYISQCQQQQQKR